MAWVLMLLSSAAGCRDDGCPAGHERLGSQCVAAVVDAEPEPEPEPESCAKDAECTTPDLGCRDANDCTKPDASVCNAAYECEGCKSDDDCAHLAGAKLCDPSKHACVGCLGDGDCRDPNRPICEEGACRGCQADSECASQGKICDEQPGAATKGSCVQCTQAPADEARCGNKSCDPATRTCTQTERGSATICEACVADSECVDDEHRCIAMTFEGAALKGGFCLKRKATGCTKPYGATAITAASLSGAASEEYCGVNESKTTCAAILMFGTECAGGNASACGAAGARCELVNGIANQCTYGCTDSLECPKDRPCGSSGDSYCGQ